MKKIWKKQKREILAAIAIVVIALLVRIINLDNLPVFADEAIYIRWAQVMRENAAFRFLPLTDGKQPLYMWVVIPFLKLIANPLVAGRIVSVISGVGTLVGVFVLTYLLFKSIKASLAAGLFYALTPFAVFFNRMALADSLLTMFGVWTLIFATLTTRKLRLDTAMLTGFALGGAWLTKSPAIFFVLLIPLTALLVKWPKKTKGKAVYLGKLIILWGITLIIGYGFYNILRLGPEFHMIAIRNKDYVYPLSHVLSSPLDPLKPYLHRSLEWLWILGPSVFLLFFVLGSALNLKKYSKEILLVLGWGVGPILVQAEFAKVFTARYIFFTLPYFCILAGSIALIKKKKFRMGIVVGLIVFIVHSLTIDYLLLSNIEAAPLPRSERSGYLEEWTAGHGIYEVSALIREEWRLDPDSQIVVGTEGFFGTLPDGLQAYLNDIKSIQIMGVGVNISDVPQELLTAKSDGKKTYMVVNNSRFSGNPETLGLKILAAYPKAVKPDGSREALLFFEVTEKALK